MWPEDSRILVKIRASELLSTEKRKVGTISNLTEPVCIQFTRAVDPHSFFANPDPAVFLNADPDSECFL